jgi:hypothetical protein
MGYERIVSVSSILTCSQLDCIGYQRCDHPSVVRCRAEALDGQRHGSYLQTSGVLSGALTNIRYWARWTFNRHKSYVLAATGMRVVIVPKMRRDCVQTFLEYVRRGSVIRSTEAVKAISRDISSTVAAAEQSSQLDEPLLFYFVEAPSGSGKTQLAFALENPVIAVSFAGTKQSNTCFHCLSEAVLCAVWKDVFKFDRDNRTVPAPLLFGNTAEFETVGLLVALYRLLFKKTNEESMRLLNGFDEELHVHYRPMTLTAGRAAMQALWQGGEAVEPRDLPLIYVDDVPPKLDEYYPHCILLRNLVRCLRSVCILAGSEAAALGSLDCAKSYVQGSAKFEYARLIVDLPALQWKLLCNERCHKMTGEVPADVVQLLQATKPLFAERVLQELVRPGGANVTSPPTLTAAALSAVKQAMMAQKKEYYGDDGLFAQFALLFPNSLQREPPRVRVQSIVGHGWEARTDQRLLEARYSIRHHFGELQVPLRFTQDGYPRIIALDYVSPENVKHGSLFAETVGGTWDRFRPHDGFAPPSRDALLYLINLRDGLYYDNRGRTERRRVSASRSLQILHYRRQADDPLNLANWQRSHSSRALEVEVGAAALIASHSFSSLAGCTLGQFLPAFIAELNAFECYTEAAQFSVKGVPRPYSGPIVGLLSPVDAPWAEIQGDDHISLQGGSVVLANYRVRPNKSLEYYSFPVLCAGVVQNASIVAKSRNGPVSTRELAKTMRYAKANNQTITIMVVTDFVRTDKLASKEYLAAAEGCCVARITGNANITHRVATELRWDYLHPPQQPQEDGDLPPHTVVMIVLETIYRGRGAVMEYMYSTY